MNPDVRAWLLVCLAGLMACNSLWAADPNPQQLELIQRQQELIQKQEQLRREELLREQDPARRQPGQVDLGSKAPEPAAREPGTCFTMSSIQLDGAVHLWPDERERLVKPYLKKCVGLPEIRDLMRAITNLYVDKGYVTTRVYIPQQDMSKGQLTLLIVEGKVGAIELDGDKTRVNRLMVFPGLVGDVLNIRDFEQGLDQLNRLQSNSATMALEPSTDPGVTRVLVSNTPRAIWTAGLTVDNYGSPPTGDQRWTTNFGLDSPLGLNEAWFVSLSRNMDADTEARLSESALLSLNVPMGYWNLLASSSTSRYVSTVATATQSFISRGDTSTFSFGLQRVLYRSQTAKLTWGSTVTHKESRNYIQDSLLTTGSPSLSDFGVNFTGVFQALGGSWTLDTGIQQGTNWFGAQQLPNAGEGTVPTGTGAKYTASATYQLPMRLGSWDMAWTSSLQSQFARDYLYGSEQMSVGGLYSVRGFDGVSISGDRGSYWRNDFAVTLPSLGLSWLERGLGRLQTYLALDVGRIQARTGQEGGTLAGAALGFRAVSGILSFDAAWGGPVHVPEAIKARQKVDNRVAYVKVALSF